jgi:heavy metal sensor kinase
MSIRLRLTVYWAAVLGGILLIAAVAMFKLFTLAQWGSLDAALLEEADTSAEEMARGGVAAAIEIAKGLSQELDLGPVRRVRLVTRSGVLADFGGAAVAPPTLDPDFGSRGIFETADGHFRFAVVPLTIAGQHAYLEDGVDAHTIGRSIERLRDILLLLVPIVLALCVGGGYWMAGRSLRPFAALAATVDAIEPSNLSSRLPVPDVADEVARLTVVINALLARLERASANERRFASDAAHELRTPLAVLRTGLEVALARQRTVEEGRNALESALQEVVRLCRIADELLMLARLDREATVDRKPVNLGEIVSEIGTAIEPVAQAKQIDLRIATRKDAVVDGNSGHLRRLVYNLLDNALKFTPEHGIVELGVERNGDKAVLRVADSGPGIESADLPMIFERFYRGRAAGKNQGSGLGLALCREIARLHGGEITASSRPGGGSEFVATLPLARSGTLPLGQAGTGRIIRHLNVR